MSALVEKPTLPCGHSFFNTESSGEGTHYCRQCALEAERDALLKDNLALRKIAQLAAEPGSPYYNRANAALSTPAPPELERLRKIEAALMNLTERLAVVHEDQRYRAVWTCAQLHYGPYEGATYTAELDAALAALQGGE